MELKNASAGRLESVWTRYDNDTTVQRIRRELSRIEIFGMNFAAMFVCNGGSRGIVILV